MTHRNYALAEAAALADTAPNQPSRCVHSPAPRLRGSACQHRLGWTFARLLGLLASLASTRSASAQPTSAQPTSAQPTSAQPTSAQPTSEAPASTQTAPGPAAPKPLSEPSVSTSPPATAPGGAAPEGAAPSPDPNGSGADATHTFNAQPSTQTGALAASEAAPSGVARRPKNRHRFGLDLNVEGAVGSLLAANQLSGFGRVRVGMLTLLDRVDSATSSPLFLATGISYELSDFSGATIGLQTEFIHIGSGLWGQAGGLFDLVEPGVGWMAAAGWSLFGIELQQRPHHFAVTNTADSLNSLGIYGKIRLPLGVILAASAQRKATAPASRQR